MRAVLFSAAVALQAGAAPEREPGGFIVQTRGAVFLCSDRASDGKQCPSDSYTKLESSRDAGRILYAGERIHCEAGAVARIHTAAVGDTKSAAFAPDVCKAGKEWVVISKLPREGVRLEGMGEGRATIAALENYGKRAGRDKGSNSLIYSPPNLGAVVPRELIVRWRNRPAPGKLAVILRGQQGQELWQLANVDGAAGVLDSEALRKALRSYEDADDAAHLAVLVLKDESGHEESSEFSMVTREREKALNQALGQVDPSHGLFRFVERAALFESAHMYDKVAAEYDAALGEAPGSRDLLQAAFQAHARTGNLRRARELRDRLQALE